MTTVGSKRGFQTHKMIEITFICTYICVCVCVLNEQLVTGSEVWRAEQFTALQLSHVKLPYVQK